MGRDTSGMEDDGPIADACKMPSFIGSFEEGRAKLSHNLTTETSTVDCKVERSVRDLSRCVTRSKSLDGNEGDLEERSSEEEEEKKEQEKGNDNNNCNGGDERRSRRTSAVEILRRNFGVSRSPSLRPNPNGRMPRGAELGAREAAVNNDVSSGYGAESDECKESERETGEWGDKNEPTLSDLTTSAVQGVEFITFTGQRHHKQDSDTLATEESCNSKEHVYCTVYCIATDSHRKDFEITDDETVASDVPEMDVEAGSSPEPVLYTLDNLVDPFGDMAHRLSTEQAGAETALHSCRVCLEEKTIEPLPCCRRAVCYDCLKLYVSPQVRIAKPYIICPIPECSGYLEEGVVISHLASEDVAKYRYFLELSQLDSSTKPCPQCSQFTSLKGNNANRTEHKYKIQCSRCQFVWCFKCHAPWHDGVKCRDYRKGDKLLRSWASVVEHGQRNAQKCPQCKIHIQRTEGCDHMTCTQCNTNFCYRCGERYRHLRFFGDHTSNLSVFGCKYRYLPDKPHLRRLIRGSVCASKLLIAPVVILLVVVLGALGLVIGLVVFPVYYVCKKRKKQQRTQGSGRWI